MKNIKKNTDNKSKYIHQFVMLTCAPDLLQRKLFPNTKEISESMGGYEAAVMCERPDNPKVLAICHGDGTRPRTGALIAYRTTWTVISIDPMLSEHFMQTDRFIRHSRRLSVICEKIEHAKISVNGFDHIIFIGVHSHASLRQCVKSISDWIEEQSITVVSIPCCVGDDLGKKPDITYEDDFIMSPRNTVNIYKLQHPMSEIKMNVGWGI